MRNIFIVVMFAVMLGGCATAWDVDIAKENSGMYKAHEASAAEQVKSKSDAIGKLTYDCSGESSDCAAAKALNNVIIAMQIKDIKAPEYDGPVLQSGVDVQKKALDTAEKIANPVITGLVSIKAIDKDKGSVTNKADNGSTINNSNDENTAIAVGQESNATNSNKPVDQTYNEGEETESSE